MDAILVVNAGSSSLKFQIFGIAGAKLERRIRGQIDGIGVRPRMRAATDEETLIDRTFEAAAIRRPARGHRPGAQLASHARGF